MCLHDGRLTTQLYSLMKRLSVTVNITRWSIQLCLDVYSETAAALNKNMMHTLMFHMLVHLTVYFM